MSPDLMGAALPDNLPAGVRQSRSDLSILLGHARTVGRSPDRSAGGKIDIREGLVVRALWETAARVLVPALIFVVALAGGATVAVLRLPPLADNPIGRLAFAGVCMLLGVALALVAMDVYLTVREIVHFTAVAASIGGNSKSDLLASGLSTILSQAGPVLGLALAVYLLAPRQDVLARLDEAFED
jgi:hypothetical protein